MHFIHVLKIQQYTSRNIDLKMHILIHVWKQLQGAMVLIMTGHVKSQMKKLYFQDKFSISIPTKIE